jgi:hypothetical protein
MLQAAHLGWLRVEKSCPFIVPTFVEQNTKLHRRGENG